MDWLAHLLQTSDSFFPSGTFSHSFGLEGIAELGIVRDAASLADFLERLVVPSIEHVELPFVRFSFDAAKIEDAARLCELDARYGAMKGARELREASARIGAQRLGILREIAPHPLLSVLEKLRADGEVQPHATILFGAQCAIAGGPLDAALHAYFYQALAALVSASLKLVRIGHLGCQKILSGFLARSNEVVARAKTISENDIGWFSPLLDIASARHEFAEARLFIS
jgi:urease accessory protein